MIKDYYVILTGGKNNAGDHLIKYRAKKLLKSIRQDRDLIDMNGWIPFSKEALSIINNSKALLLTGGPALQKDMWSNVYALSNSLDDIKVPIITMGIGWHSKNGKWEDTHNYKLSDKTLDLLNRIEHSGYLSSVRDYHTLNVLNHIGKKNFLMTGCPALYDVDYKNTDISIDKNIKKIGFSLGVSLQNSPAMYKQMQNMLLKIKNKFDNAKIDVVFHHSPFEEYLNTHGSNYTLYKAQQKYLLWLQQENISYTDISGSADKLINYYNSIDLHIGYRVHAHIYMSSIAKPSILLCEDGRGKALRNVLGGLIFDAYEEVEELFIHKVLHRLSLPYEPFTPMKNLISDIDNTIEYEINNKIRFTQPKIEIDRYFTIMKKFVEQLP